MKTKFLFKINLTTIGQCLATTKSIPYEYFLNCDKKSHPGPAVSTPCWTPPTQRTTSPSSPPYRNISPPPGAPSTLTYRCSLSCFQVTISLIVSWACSNGLVHLQLFLIFVREWCHDFLFYFLAGLYFCFNRLTDANIFIIMYGVTSIYFAVRISVHFLHLYVL